MAFPQPHDDEVEELAIGLAELHGECRPSAWTNTSNDFREGWRSKARATWGLVFSVAADLAKAGDAQ